MLSRCPLAHARRSSSPTRRPAARSTCAVAVACTMICWSWSTTPREHSAQWHAAKCSNLKACLTSHPLLTHLPTQILTHLLTDLLSSLLLHTSYFTPLTSHLLLLTPLNLCLLLHASYCMSLTSYLSLCHSYFTPLTSPSSPLTSHTSHLTPDFSSLTY